MVFVSSRVCAKENITQKSVTSTTARKKTHAKKDTLKTVRDTLQENAGSKMIVPSSIQAAMSSRISVK